MYIGTFAKLTGTTPKTIRYYESIGLLPAPLRVGKFRVYDDTYIETVLQIKMAQELGFKLSEIKSYMINANVKKGFPVSVLLHAINLRREQLTSEIDGLQLLDKQLSELQNKLTKSKCNLDSDL